MRHRKKRHKMGRKSQHRQATLRNMATALIRNERIHTTLGKAKALRPYIEPIVTRAKKADLHARRLILRDIQDKEMVRKLFDEIAPRMADRPGGYTRIVKTHIRPGDGAPMAFIEFVDFEFEEDVDVDEGEEQEEAKGGGLLSRLTGAGQQG